MVGLLKARQKLRVAGIAVILSYTGTENVPLDNNYAVIPYQCTGDLLQVDLCSYISLILIAPHPLITARD